MRVVVTGAAGFIGSWTAQRLLERGDEVVGIDNFDPFYARPIKLRNLGALQKHARFSFHEIDLRDDERLASPLAGADILVHLAALAGVRPSLQRPAVYMDVNVEGTTKLLERCREAQIDRIVVASSSSVYGVRSRTPFREDDPCDAPASPYAASKRASELVCSTWHQLYGLGITCLRYFTVYGPRQRPEMAIHRFVRLALAGEPIPMFGDGTSARDYTFIEDIIDGTLAAIDRQDGEFHLYNLGGSQSIALRALIDEVARAVDRPVAVEQKPWQSGDVPVTSADISLAGRELGYRPRTPLSEGLDRFVAWYRSVS